MSAGTIEGAPAAQYCAGVTFANGRSGYLPSAGEVVLCYQYLGRINECLAAIGGVSFDLEGRYYWTSTQVLSTYAWCWRIVDMNLYINHKGDYIGVRAVSVF